MRRRPVRTGPRKRIEPFSILIKIFVVLAMIATFLVAANAIRSAKSGKDDKPDFPSYLTVFPESLDFGPVPYNAPKPLSVKITNTGRNKVFFSKILSSSTEFNLPTRFPGQELAKGETAEFAVVFKPSYPGEAVGKITVESSDVGRQFVEIHCKGYGVMPSIQIQPSEIEFWHCEPGYELIHELYLINKGTSPLAIREVTAGSDKFEVEGKLPPQPLQPGQHVKLLIHYRPGLMEERNTRLTVISNDPIKPAASIVLITEKPKKNNGSH